jgi:hypothetical protein
MATTLHVNGRADIYIGTQASANPSSLLGWTVDGVEISTNHYTEDVYTDNKGQHIPEDIQNFGTDARITVDLIKYDATVLAGITDRLATSSNGIDGNELTKAGELMYACNDLISVGIKRTQTQACENAEPEQGPSTTGWTFPYAYLADERSWKVGTRVTRHRLTFRAIPSASGRLFY